MKGGGIVQVIFKLPLGSLTASRFVNAFGAAETDATAIAKSERVWDRILIDDS